MDQASIAALDRLKRFRARWRQGWMVDGDSGLTLGDLDTLIGDLEGRPKKPVPVGRRTLGEY